MNRSAAAVVLAAAVALTGVVGALGAAGLVPVDPGPQDVADGTPTPAERPAFAHEGDALTLANDPGQTVAGTTDLAPGTEVTVRLTSTSGQQPFIKSRTVAVDEDGGFAVTVDGSGLEAGTTFTAVLRHDGTELANVSGEVVEGTVEATPSDDGADVVDHDGDALTLRNATDQTVSGTTDLPADTEVTVRIRSAASDQPFIKQRTTTVDDDGRFAVAVDLSDVESGADVTVTVRADGETIGEVDGEIVAADG